jgi:integrase
MAVVKFKGNVQNIKVSYFKPKRLYRKYVGGRMFYLGPDKFTAQKIVGVIFGLRAVRKVNGEEWQEEDLEFIRMAKEQLYKGRGRVALKWGDQRFELEHGSLSESKQGKRSKGRAKGVSGAAMVGEAMEAFKTQLSNNPIISDSHKSTMVNKIDALKTVLKPDRALASMGYDQLTALVNKLTSRPKSAATGKKIAAQTAINLIAAARQFFNWLRDSGKWEDPRGFDRIFRVNRKALLTNQERRQAAQGVEVFTVDELAKLWQAANEQNRLFISLALNCGFAQMEIATLRTWEIELEAVPKRIARHRRKTEVYGSWMLWGVTADLLERRLGWTPKNAEDYALLTRNGQPYVSYGNGNRTDVIGQAWTKLVKKAGVTKLGFRYLRKTGADMIRKIGGLEVSEAYLAHSEKTLARFYSNRDFDKLADALGIMETKLAAVFALELKQPEKSKKKAGTPVEES